MIDALNRTFAAIGGWCFDHRLLAGLLCLGALAGALALSARARIDNSYEAFFDPEDPTYTAYAQYREDFGSDEVSYILYESPDAQYGAFDLEVMRKVAQLTEALEAEVPFVYEVTSLANAELVIGLPDGIEITELWRDPPQTQAALLRARSLFLGKPLYVGSLVSPDGRHGAIVVEMDRASTDPIEEIRLDPDGGDGLDNLYPQVSSEKIEEILARPEYADIDFFHSGDVPLNTAYNRIIERESSFLSALSSVAIGALLAFFFRSVLGVLGPILIVQISVMVAVASASLLGWKLDMMFGSVPNLLTAVGVAHSVHILAEFRSLHAQLGDRREALCRALHRVGTPCLLTSLTTAAGFLALASSPIKAIAHMAVYSAIGVLAAFVLSLLVLSVLLSLGRRQPKRRADAAAVLRARGGERMLQALAAIARFDVRHRVAICVAFCAVFVASGLGIARLTVDSNWLEDFSERVPLKAATLHIDEVMGGMTNLVYLFDAGAPDRIVEPAVLAEVERVQQAALEHDFIVKKSQSIADILKDLNQAFHEGNPAASVLPRTRALAAQYLILYESVGGEEAEEWLTPDRARANLELRLRVAELSHTARLVEEIEAQLAAVPLSETEVSLTGIGALWLKLLDYITTSQIRGFLLAFAVIAVLMCLLFRSLPIGLISMVPNLSPVVLTLGAMGWLAIPLDYSKITIASVAIGIAVDDTIHLVSRYHREFARRGDYREALLAALQDVGRALFITSAALVLGFLMFLASVLDSQVNYGLLLAATIVFALLADFLLMPALVLVFHPFGPEGVGARTELRETA
jgi:predicted RND superfamily exporter protein